MGCRRYELMRMCHERCRVPLSIGEVGRGQAKVRRIGGQARKRHGCDKNEPHSQAEKDDQTQDQAEPWRGNPQSIGPRPRCHRPVAHGKLYGKLRGGLGETFRPPWRLACTPFEAKGATSAEVGVRAVSTQAQDLFGAVGTPRVIVFGAGLGGVAAGVALKRAGIETFTIFERSSSPGGT